MCIHITERSSALLSRVSVRGFSHTAPKSCLLPCPSETESHFLSLKQMEETLSKALLFSFTQRLQKLDAMKKQD